MQTLEEVVKKINEQEQMADSIAASTIQVKLAANVLTVAWVGTRDGEFVNQKAFFRFTGIALED